MTERKNSPKQPIPDYPLLPHPLQKNNLLRRCTTKMKKILTPYWQLPPPSSPHRSGASSQRLGSSRVSPRACHSRQAGLHVFPFFVPVRVLVQDTEKLASSRRSNRTEWASDITLIYIVWHFHSLFFCLLPSCFLVARSLVYTLLPLFSFSSFPFTEQVYKYFLETLLHLFFAASRNDRKI